jgi:hypothetical protein
MPQACSQRIPVIARSLMAGGSVPRITTTIVTMSSSQGTGSLRLHLRRPEPVIAHSAGDLGHDLRF